MYICCRCTRYREVGVVRVSSRYIIIQVGGTYRTGPYPAPTYVTIISLVYHEPFSLHGRLISAQSSCFLVLSHCVALRTREDMWCCTVCIWACSVDTDFLRKNTVDYS